jgi:hypothetical protein
MVLLAYWRAAPQIPGGSKARMAHRKPPKLAFFNEYLPPGSDNEEVYRARLLLIEAIKRCVPEFLQELLTIAFPLYENLADGGYNFNRIVWGPSAYQLLTEDRGLKRALADWSARFNAQRELVLVGALRTMRDWRTNRESRERLKWNTVNLLYGLAAQISEEFRFRAWDVQSELWPAYRRALLDELTKYEQKTRESAEAHGLRRARRTYSPVNLEWFALFQFAGKSYKEIADKYTTDESTVLKGIKAAAKLVAWDRLRQPNRHGKIR